METEELKIRKNMSCKDVVRAVEGSGAAVGLGVTLRTSLVSFPGSVHWHFRKHGERRGTLEMTFWPERRRLWVKIQAGRRAGWIRGAMEALATEMKRRMRARRRGGVE